MDYFRQNKSGLLIVSIVGLLVFCVTVSVLLIANKQSMSKPTDSLNADFKIELTRGVCFGFCPAYTLEISADASARFTGQSFTTTDGETVEYRVDSEGLKRLISMVEKMDFFSLKDRYEDPYVTDLPSMEIKVTNSGKTKSIYIYGFVGKDYPQELEELGELIDIVGKTENYKNNAIDLPLPADDQEYTR